MKKSKYKKVYWNNRMTCWYIHLRHQIYGKTIQKTFKDDREAALYLDEYLITKGKEPINILKRKI